MENLSCKNCKSSPSDRQPPVNESASNPPNQEQQLQPNISCTLAKQASTFGDEDEDLCVNVKQETGPNEAKKSLSFKEPEWEIGNEKKDLHLNEEQVTGPTGDDEKNSLNDEEIKEQEILLTFLDQESELTEDSPPKYEQRKRVCSFAETPYIIWGEYVDIYAYEEQEFTPIGEDTTEDIGDDTPEDIGDDTPENIEEEQLQSEISPIGDYTPEDAEKLSLDQEQQLEPEITPIGDVEKNSQQPRSDGQPTPDNQGVSSKSGVTKKSCKIYLNDDDELCVIEEQEFTPIAYITPEDLEKNSPRQEQQFKSKKCYSLSKKTCKIYLNKDEEITVIEEQDTTPIECIKTEDFGKTILRQEHQLEPKICYKTCKMYLNENKEKEEITHADVGKKFLNQDLELEITSKNEQREVTPIGEDFEKKLEPIGDVERGRSCSFSRTTCIIGDGDEDLCVIEEEDVAPIGNDTQEAVAVLEEEAQEDKVRATSPRNSLQHQQFSKFWKCCAKRCKKGSKKKERSGAIDKQKITPIGDAAPEDFEEKSLNKELEPIGDLEQSGMVKSCSFARTTCVIKDDDENLCTNDKQEITSSVDESTEDTEKTELESEITPMGDNTARDVEKKELESEITPKRRNTPRYVEKKELESEITPMRDNTPRYVEKKELESEITPIGDNTPRNVEKKELKSEITPIGDNTTRDVEERELEITPIGDNTPRDVEEREFESEITPIGDNTPRDFEERELESEIAPIGDNTPRDFEERELESDITPIGDNTPGDVEKNSLNEEQQLEPEITPSANNGSLIQEQQLEPEIMPRSSDEHQTLDDQSAEGGVGSSSEYLNQEQQVEEKKYTFEIYLSEEQEITPISEDVENDSLGEEQQLGSIEYNTTEDFETNSPNSDGHQTPANGVSVKSSDGTSSKCLNEEQQVEVKKNSSLTKKTCTIYLNEGLGVVEEQEITPIEYYTQADIEKNFLNQEQQAFLDEHQTPDQQSGGRTSPNQEQKSYTLTKKSCKIFMNVNEELRVNVEQQFTPSGIFERDCEQKPGFPPRCQCAENNLCSEQTDNIRTCRCTETNLWDEQETDNIGTYKYGEIRQTDNKCEESNLWAKQQTDNLGTYKSAERNFSGKQQTNFQSTDAPPLPCRQSSCSCNKRQTTSCNCPYAVGLCLAEVPQLRTTTEFNSKCDFEELIVIPNKASPYGIMQEADNNDDVARICQMDKSRLDNLQSVSARVEECGYPYLVDKCNTVNSNMGREDKCSATSKGQILDMLALSFCSRGTSQVRMSDKLVGGMDRGVPQLVNSGNAPPSYCDLDSHMRLRILCSSCARLNGSVSKKCQQCQRAANAKRSYQMEKSTSLDACNQSNREVLVNKIIATSQDLRRGMAEMNAIDDDGGKEVPGTDIKLSNDDYTCKLCVDYVQFKDSLMQWVNGTVHELKTAMETLERMGETTDGKGRSAEEGVEGEPRRAKSKDETNAENGRRVDKGVGGRPRKAKSKNRSKDRSKDRGKDRGKDRSKERSKDKHRKR